MIATVRKFFIGLLLASAPVLHGAELADPIELRERPRVFRGPYNEAVVVNQFYASSFWAYPGFYSPFYSPLMFAGPTMPGRSSVSFAVGSDGYVGTAFSTSDWIEGTNLLYSLDMRREQGETWYSGQDYQLTTIAPGLSWSNGSTSVFLGFEMSELSVDSAPVATRDRPRVDTGPLRSDLHVTRNPTPSIDLESLNVGLTQRIGDSSFLSLSVGERSLDADYLGTGLSHRLREGPGDIPRRY